eukprot:987064-Amphidinium_carterae.1
MDAAVASPPTTLWLLLHMYQSLYRVCACAADLAVWCIEVQLGLMARSQVMKGVVYCKLVKI